MKLVGNAVTALIISEERRQRTEQRNQSKVVDDIVVATISAAFLYQTCFIPPALMSASESI
jgi:hypothetical protein